MALQKIRLRLFRSYLWARSNWWDLSIISLGTLMVSLSYVLLIIPHTFPASGVNGVAVLTTYIWGISPAWVIGIGNGALLLWAWRELSPSFVVKTAFSVALMTVLLKVLLVVPVPLIKDPLLIVIFAGLINGMGSGLVFRAEACMGGTDVIAMVLRKRYGIDLGIYSFLLSSSVLLLAVFVVGIEKTLYGGLLLYITGLMVDNTLRSFDRRKQILLITRYPDEISSFILKELHRGVTRLNGEGGFSKQPRPVLLTYLSQGQVVRLRRFVLSMDSNAFMAVSDASEVRGQGFKSWKGL
ncbi:MAG TPA: YitT family protein [Synergistaceae bacterium]|nr:YitT family protein [Synergistaceae bacterium]